MAMSAAAAAAATMAPVAPVVVAVAVVAVDLMMQMADLVVVGLMVAAAVAMVVGPSARRHQ